MSTTASDAERGQAQTHTPVQPPAASLTGVDSSASSDGHDESGTATLISQSSNGESQTRRHQQDDTPINDRARKNRGKGRGSGTKQSWLSRLFGLEQVQQRSDGERQALLGGRRGGGVGADDNEDEDESEEDGYESRYNGKGKVWILPSRDWRTWLTFGLLVALGILLGVLSTKGVQKWEEGRDPGPLVPPVYTLPPVCPLASFIFCGTLCGTMVSMAGTSDGERPIPCGDSECISFLSTLYHPSTHQTRAKILAHRRAPQSRIPNIRHTRRRILRRHHLLKPRPLHPAGSQRHRRRRGHHHHPLHRALERLFVRYRRGRVHGRAQARSGRGVAR